MKDDLCSLKLIVKRAPSLFVPVLVVDCTGKRLVDSENCGFVEEGLCKYGEELIYVESHLFEGDLVPGFGHQKVGDGNVHDCFNETHFIFIKL